MKRDSERALQALTGVSDRFPQFFLKNCIRMVNNCGSSRSGICILETMMSRTASFPHTLSAASLAVIAVILAYAGIDGLTANADFAALAGAIAGGGMLGRLMRRPDHPRR